MYNDSYLSSNIPSDHKCWVWFLYSILAATLQWYCVNFGCWRPVWEWGNQEESFVDHWFYLFWVCLEKHGLALDRKNTMENKASLYMRKETQSSTSICLYTCIWLHILAISQYPSYKMYLCTLKSNVFNSSSWICSTYSLPPPIHDIKVSIDFDLIKLGLSKSQQIIKLLYSWWFIYLFIFCPGWNSVWKTGRISHWQSVFNTFSGSSFKVYSHLLLI